MTPPHIFCESAFRSYLKIFRDLSHNAKRRRLYPAFGRFYRRHFFLQRGRPTQTMSLQFKIYRLSIPRVQREFLTNKTIYLSFKHS